MSRMLKLSQQKERTVRGKYAEDKVRDELKRASDRRADFDFKRNYDARSSMGRIPQQTGDFEFYSPGEHGVIEVKQVAHPYRLPKKNFNPEKWGVLLKRRMAGGRILIVVFHSDVKKWRLVPFDFFLERKEQPSWDVSQFRAYDDARMALYMVGIPTHDAE